MGMYEILDVFFEEIRRGGVEKLMEEGVSVAEIYDLLGGQVSCYAISNSLARLVKAGWLDVERLQGGVRGRPVRYKVSERTISLLKKLYEG